MQQATRLRDSWAGPHRHGTNQPPWRLCPQVTITFKDLAVRFSEEEWRLLEEGQREFYREVMRENYETLVSVGTSELLPLSAFLSPMEPGKAVLGREHAAKGQELPAGGAPQGTQPQHSLHLSALVQLVKEIPEFLFREAKGGTVDSPESRAAGLDGDRASPEVTAVAIENCPLQGQLSCLPDSPSDQHSLATTPTGSSSSSGLPGDKGRESPLPIAETVSKPWSTGKTSPGSPGGEPSPLAYSPSRRKSHRGTLGTGVPAGLSDPDPVYATGTSPRSSPLQGLIGGQKEIPVPSPQHPEVTAKPLPPLPGLVSSKLPRVELGPVSLPWPVKTEAVSRDCPLQGLMNCLKEIPEAPGRRPSPSGAEEPLLHEEPGAWRRICGGPGRQQTPPLRPGPGGVLTMVKMEDSWAQSPLVPTTCQLGRQTYSPSTSRDTKGIRGPSWGPVAQAGRASSSPLEALEACLKGIPPSASSLPLPLVASWSQSPQPGDPGARRSEPHPHGSQSEEVTKEPVLPLAPRGCVREGPARPSCPRGTPTGFSSASSTDGDLDFMSPARSQGQWPRKGSPPGSSPLQSLENCLREIPVPKPQLAWPCSSAADRGPRRMDLKNWATDKEALRSESCEPAHPGQGGGEVPARSLHLASPQAFSSCAPACHPRGIRDHGTTRPGPEHWLQDGSAARPSPLHCLESSLRDILPVRPLRFACLAGPGPGPSPSPSSSSSLSSSDGEDLKLEPELWQQSLQVRNHLPSCRHPVRLSPSPQVAPLGSRGSKSGEAPGRAEPQSCGVLSSGEAEKVAEGRSQSPEREESGCQPGAPRSTGEGGAVRAPCPAPQLEKRPRPEDRDEARALEPTHGKPSTPAEAQGKLHPCGLPQAGDESLQPQPPTSPPPAADPAMSSTACSCGKPLQQELHSLGAALEEKLDRLASVLAGLAQEVATMRTQVDRLGRRPRGPESKPWALPRGPRWANGLGRRHTPYWRQKGPSRPKPKILRAQAEGCRAGDSPGLPRGRARPAPQLPTDGAPTEPPGPPSSALSCCAVLGHMGSHQVPPPPLVPVALPPPTTSPTPSADAESARIPGRPKEPSDLLGGMQRALQEELWGSEHRDPRWGAH
ncbi:protein KRBA1 isoform X3 [Ochotona princeps]|uniref:protein KRBA1 isoform X3 n=1 Tax=Ochotona princeps TaxID=9978 RepID=UPI0027155407|nr:protein KRBA1 isoform X3 [Ochotona princeps]